MKSILLTLSLIVGSSFTVLNSYDFLIQEENSKIESELSKDFQIDLEFEKPRLCGTQLRNNWLNKPFH